MKDPHLTDCQLCAAAGSVKRMIGAGAGIIFKGSGFYETDFKEKKGEKPGSAEKPKAENSSPKADAPAVEAKTSKKKEAKASASTKSTE